MDKDVVARSGNFVSQQSTSGRDLDLACLSYIAACVVLRLARYPPWNEGSEITSADPSLAGDGPLVAGFAAGLGLRVGLETNDVADDDAGRDVRAVLERWQIAHTLQLRADRTPRAYILAHPDGGREWLVNLERAATDLAATSGATLRRAETAYIDCFASISAGAIHALDVARAHGCAVHANVGTMNMPDDLERALAAAPLEVVQASLAEDLADTAVEVGRRLAKKFAAALTYVTVGSHGAIALQGDTVVVSRAREIEVDYTHGAGAAFSAGVIYGRARDWPLQEITDFGCALGSMQCSAGRLKAPSETDVLAFIKGTGAARGGPDPGRAR